MLTPRQAEIAGLVAKGMSNKAIARELDIAVRTVEEHVAGAARRLPGRQRPRYKLILFALTDEIPTTP